MKIFFTFQLSYFTPTSLVMANYIWAFIRHNFNLWSRKYQFENCGSSNCFTFSSPSLSMGGYGAPNIFHFLNINRGYNPSRFVAQHPVLASLEAYFLGMLAFVHLVRDVTSKIINEIFRRNYFFFATLFLPFNLGWFSRYGEKFCTSVSLLPSNSIFLDRYGSAAPVGSWEKKRWKNIFRDFWLSDLLIRLRLFKVIQFLHLGI